MVHRRTPTAAIFFAALIAGVLAGTHVYAQTSARIVQGPGSNAKDISPDTLLYRSDMIPDYAAAHGPIEIRDAADDSVAARIDPKTLTATQAIGGLPDYVYYTHAPQAFTLFPPNHALTYHKTYYVWIPKGLFKSDDLTES